MHLCDLVGQVDVDLDLDLELEFQRDSRRLDLNDEAAPTNIS
jgi:hypothetical protein